MLFFFLTGYSNNKTIYHKYRNKEFYKQVCIPRTYSDYTVLIRFGANKLMINGQVFTHVAVILILY